MAQFVTATFSVTDGEMELLNKKTKTFEIRAFHLVGAFEDKEELEKVLERSLRGSKDMVLVDIDNVTIDTAKYRMREWVFVSIAHPVKDDEKKANLITRTLKSSTCETWRALTEEDIESDKKPHIFKETAYLSGEHTMETATKYLRKAAAFFDTDASVFLRIVPNTLKTFSTLYGVDKSEFIAKAERVELNWEESED